MRMERASCWLIFPDLRCAEPEMTKRRLYMLKMKPQLASCHKTPIAVEYACYM